MKNAALFTLAALTMTPMVQAGPRYVPVVSGLFSTGQWYFEGERSSLGGNAGLTVIPAMQFSNTFSVIPTVESNYRGTRSAEELAGGNTLFQDTWENGANVKAVHTLSENWSVREKVGYKFKWFRETTDESWSNGLYDYNIYSGGADVERKFGKKAGVALGYDFSYVRFPNYISLESTQGDNAREFAGDKVLDSRVHLFSMRARSPLFWKMQSTWQGFYSPRNYPNQHIAEISSQLSPEIRKDTYIGGVLSIDRVFNAPFKSKLISTLQYAYSGLNSNQNHYDAGNSTFVADYYDYDQKTIGAQFSLAFGKKLNSPMIVETGYSYTNRNYRSRTIQASDSTYQAEKLSSIDQMINLGFSYPLSKNFRVRTTANFAQTSSNNHYEAYYRYNYHSSNYQFGFTYDY